MLSYLLTQFAEEFEAEDCKPSAVATPVCDWFYLIYVLEKLLSPLI